eukprot:NODE_12265_length_517_cov_71.677665_g11976_i0.p1 GENE.NODE_12265_length_517_cov_71.677665_g11976_i0~~NODE_12265_length_517_cov_71.677665_g11976_i0.p1  ORF type:complete len:145 (-),score=28.57 NODE_12265_length_517_cov_71.677665_g11976_i0:5-439(-)
MEKQKLPNYIEDAVKFDKFIRQYQDNGTHKYLVMLQEIADRKRKVFQLSLDDMHAIHETDLADRIRNNTHSYTEHLSKVIDDNMPAPSPDAAIERDVQDVLNEDRRRGDEGAALPKAIPAAMVRRYQLVITCDFHKKLPPRTLR